MIFGYGIMICLFAGGFSFFAYIAAIIIGGETAEQICYVVYKIFYPYIVYATSILVLIGIIKMYLCGETALKSSGKK